MKSIAQQICETQDALIASGKFTADVLKESVKEAVSEEHRLSILKTLTKKNGIKESVVIAESHQRITRNNGSGVRATDAEKFNERVKTYAKKHKVSLQEASLMLGGKLETTIPADIAEKVAAWRKYCKTLTIDEATSLVRRGLSVPKN